MCIVFYIFFENMEEKGLIAFLIYFFDAKEKSKHF